MSDQAEKRPEDREKRADDRCARCSHQRHWHGPGGRPMCHHSGCYACPAFIEPPSGADPVEADTPVEAERCPNCGGHGTVPEEGVMPPGRVRWVICPTCDATCRCGHRMEKHGVLSRTPCTSCDCRDFVAFAPAPHAVEAEVPQRKEEMNEIPEGFHARDGLTPKHHQERIEELEMALAGLHDAVASHCVVEGVGTNVQFTQDGYDIGRDLRIARQVLDA